MIVLVSGAEYTPHNHNPDISDEGILESLVVAVGLGFRGLVRQVSAEGAEKCSLPVCHRVS